ncbi:MAG: NADH-quinone oxidoreductase subunit J [Pseudomonadota bacterium]
MEGTSASASASATDLLAPLASPEGAIFLILSLAIVGMSIFCMTRRNPVTAVMSLVATFFGLAALYATLSAHFLAVLQVLVYAGAIMVLFIFVVMILNREESTLVSLRGLPSRLLGIVAGLYMMAVFVRVVIPSGGAAALPPAAVSDTYGTVASVGDVLFRQFMFPFEAISLLLLVAIVGGVVVSRSSRKESDAVEAAEKRIAITGLSKQDYPAEADADAGAGHSSGGGHH